MEPVETISYKGFDIEIHQDDTPESPREWDNLGEMICFHSQYSLGDGHSLSVEDTKELANRKDVIALPLFLYDHSGLRMKVGSFAGLLPEGHARFDSGQVGFIFAFKAAIRKEWKVKRISKKLLKTVIGNLESEVETYDQYLSGQAYGYQVKDADGEDGDSCWGYYGSDWEENDLLNSARAAVDCHIEQVKHDNLCLLLATV